MGRRLVSSGQGPRGVRRTAHVGIVGLLLGVAAAAGVAVATPSSAAGLFVVGEVGPNCPDAATNDIQVAIDHASSGDTIQVCPGTYYGEFFDEGKDLTFRGPQAGVDARSNRPLPGSEAIISGSLGADFGFSLGGVSSIDGFWFDDFNKTDSIPVMTYGDGSSVKNSVFADGHAGISVNASGFAASQNLFDTDEDGISFFSGQGSGARLADNLFTGTLQDGAIIGVTFSGPDKPTDVQVTGNRATANMTGALAVFSRVSGLMIADNVIEQSNSEGAAIGVGGGVEGFTLTRNVVKGNDDAAIDINADNAFGANTGGVITQNRLQNNRRDIQLGSGESVQNGPLEVHSNVLTTSTTGTVSNPNAAIREVLNFTQPTPINATDNFWGCNTGPGTSGCSTILASAVTSDPYLVLTSSIGTTTLGPNQSTPFTVNLNSNSAGAPVVTPVLDGLPVTFTVSNFLRRTPTTGTLVNGTATTTVRPKPDGLGHTGQSARGQVVNASSSQSPITVVPAKPSIRVGDTSSVEGTSGTHPVNFTVKLSHAYNANVTVRFTTANGSATTPSDYLAKSGTLTFAPGQTSKTVAVTVKGDKVKEANETFFLNLSAPTNATIADPNGSCVIRNS